MASQWVRLYTEIRSDRKLRRLSPAQRWLWVVMLTIAKESPQPGRLLLAEGVPVTVEDLADDAAISIEEVRAGLQAFINQRMVAEVDGFYHLINWNKRQFVSDSSTERVKKHRSNQEPGHETLVQRCSNTLETPPEAEADPDPDTVPDKEEGVTCGERTILNSLKNVAGYPFDYQKDLQHIRALAVDFPDVNLQEEVRKWATYKLDKPLTAKSNPRSQLRSWMTKVIEFSKGGKTYGRKPTAAQDDISEFIIT